MLAEVRRDEALHRRKRLTTLVAELVQELRYGLHAALLLPVVVQGLGQGRRADLQVVAKHPVVANLQVLEARALSLSPFEPHQPLAAVRREGAELVQLCDSPL